MQMAKSTTFIHRETIMQQGNNKDQKLQQCMYSKKKKLRHTKNHRLMPIRIKYGWMDNQVTAREQKSEEIILLVYIICKALNYQAFKMGYIGGQMSM
jgi:hypothetical protein